MATRGIRARWRVVGVDTGGAEIYDFGHSFSKAGALRTAMIQLGRVPEIGPGMPQYQVLLLGPKREREVGDYRRLKDEQDAKMGLFLRRGEMLDVPEPVPFGVIKLPDLDVWRRNQQAVALTLEYVAEVGGRTQLPAEGDWFVRQFANSIWGTDGGSLGLEGLKAVENFLRITAMAGTAFAAVDGNDGARCPRGQSLVSVLCALDFCFVLMSDEYPRLLMAAGSYSTRVAHYLCRSGLQAEHFVPDPMETGSYLNDERYATAADAVRLTYKEGE